MPYQPLLQINADLSITSVILSITSSALITVDTASGTDSSSVLPSTNTADTTPKLAFTGHVASSSTAITVKLYWVNLLEEMIGQFKDEILDAAFWAELMGHTAEGADPRLPSLCPK